MKMMNDEVKEIVSVLNADEQQLLKDAICFGGWGDDIWKFIAEDGTIESVPMYAYCTNDARKGGHFSGRKISALFKSMYSKLCTKNQNQIGRYISHCHDWWGDGSGDMLFIRNEYSRAFEEWACS